MCASRVWRLRASQVAVGQGQVHSPDTKRTAEPFEPLAHRLTLGADFNPPPPDAQRSPPPSRSCARGCAARALPRFLLKQASAHVKSGAGWYCAPEEASFSGKSFPARVSRHKAKRPLTPFVRYAKENGVSAKALADVAKQVDARDLKSLDFGHTGSTPVVRTRSQLPPRFDPRVASSNLHLPARFLIRSRFAAAAPLAPESSYTRVPIRAEGNDRHSFEFGR